MKGLKGILLVLSFPVFLTGCGYTTHAYVTQTGYKSIYVTPFLNKVDTTTEFSEGNRFMTYFPLLENTITNTVVDKYKFDGTLRISKEEDADLVLKGELINYRRDTMRNTTSDTPAEYRITLFMHLVLIDNKTKKILWEKNGFAGDSSYFTTGNFVKTESQALQDAAADLARRIVEATVEAW